MKKSLYPKTKRISTSKFIITEKLDWSNLWLFKLNWELIIAQRNNVFKLSEINKDIAYKWLIGWLDKYKDSIDLHEWSWVFWERIWMWNIKYWDDIDKKFYIFAKANITEDFEVKNINYTRDYFIYPFISQEIPYCMDIVPLFAESKMIDISMLDTLYDDYVNTVNRKVEWFVIINNNQVLKYVRYKDWKETEHKPWK